MTGRWNAEKQTPSKKYLCTFREFIFAQQQRASDKVTELLSKFKIFYQKSRQESCQKAAKKTAGRKRSIMCTQIEAFPSRFRLSGWQSVDVSNKSCQFISPPDLVIPIDLFSPFVGCLMLLPDRSDAFAPLPPRQLLLTTSESLSARRQSVEELSEHCADGWERKTNRTIAKRLSEGDERGSSWFIMLILLFVYVRASNCGFLISGKIPSALTHSRSRTFNYFSFGTAFVQRQPQ